MVKGFTVENFMCSTMFSLPSYFMSRPLKNILIYWKIIAFQSINIYRRLKNLSTCFDLSHKYKILKMFIFDSNPSVVLNKGL